MKDNSVLIRLSDEELSNINKAYKKELVSHDLISRSEFIRRIIKLGLKNYKE